MSHWISLTDTTASGVDVEVYDVNWTYNFTPALNEAGLWWSDCDGRTAAEVGVHVNLALTRIQADPERYRPLIRGGGASTDTGTCRTHHKATFDRV